MGYHKPVCIVESSSFCGNDLANRSDESVIERRTHQNRLWEARAVAVLAIVAKVRVRPSYAMEALAPPLIWWYTKAFYTW